MYFSCCRSVALQLLGACSKLVSSFRCESLPCFVLVNSCLPKRVHWKSLISTCLVVVVAVVVVIYGCLLRRPCALLLLLLRCPATVGNLFLARVVVPLLIVASFRPRQQPSAENCQPPIPVFVASRVHGQPYHRSCVLPFPFSNHVGSSRPWWIVKCQLQCQTRLKYVFFLFVWRSLYKVTEANRTSVAQLQTGSECNLKDWV